MSDRRLMTRKDVTEFVAWVLDLAYDMAKLANTHDSPSFRFSTYVNGPATRSMRSQTSELSAHRQMELRAKANAEFKEEYEQFRSFFAHIPPLLSARSLSLHWQGERYGDGGNLDIEIDHIHITSHGESRRELQSQAISDIWAFMRIHDNIAMGPNLREWVLHSRGNRPYYPIFADTAEHAVLRFAAIDREVRNALYKGEMPVVAPVLNKPSDDLVAKARRKVATSAPEDHEWKLITK